LLLTNQLQHQKQLKEVLELKEAPEVEEEDKREHQEEEEEDKREHQEEEEVVNIEVEEEVQEEELKAIKLTNQDPIDLELLLLQMLTETKLLKNQEKKDNHSEEKMEIILLKDNLEPEEASRPK